LTTGSRTPFARFYERLVAEADRLYDEHIEALTKEGLI
jgi:hypothetical protein